MNAAATVIPSDDSTSVFDVLRSLSTLERQAIVRPKNPPDGIAGFVFNIPQEEEINLRSEITDHFVEDNTAINDEIALKPEEFTLRGLVAEVAVRPLASRLQSSSRRWQPLPINPLPAPVPRTALAQILVQGGTLARILAPGSAQIVGVAKALEMSPAGVVETIVNQGQVLATALGIGDEAAKALALSKVLVAANKSASKPASRRNPNAAAPIIPPLTPLVAPALQPDPASLYGTFLDKAAQPPSQTRQARTFAYFYQLWKSRQLFTVETPWGFLTDVAILSFRSSQDETTRFASTFSVTFKKIRTAGAATVTAGQLAGRASIQSAPVTNNGNAGKTPLTPAQKQSLLFRMATSDIPTP